MPTMGTGVHSSGRHQLPESLSAPQKSRPWMSEKRQQKVKVRCRLCGEVRVAAAAPCGREEVVPALRVAGRLAAELAREVALPTQGVRSQPWKGDQQKQRASAPQHWVSGGRVEAWKACCPKGP
mmetsp:Transcript_54097/g.168912  ORF Transcript_54097/g.168912 Transcript_54097/m.168912 type:complete len:124 (+) Transcript_54097:81-452(+)